MRKETSKGLWSFIRFALGELFHGRPAYWIWVGFLLITIAIGAYGYFFQLRDGLVVTNMTNQVSWGFYIANFTFLVGVAAAAVMLVIPAYIFHRKDIKDVVLMGDTMAIVAVIMAILFILVDLGRPDRIWHLIPGIGQFHFPESILAWDVLVLNGYLLLNFAISFYIVFNHYRKIEPTESYYLPIVIIIIFWAISIHTVTAFLYSANIARPFWHNSLLAPRFISSAFASGSAIMAISLQIIRAVSNYPISQSVIKHLSLVTVIALQVTVFFVGVELFTDFYNEGAHALSARYLYLGLNGHNALQPWIWTAIGLLIIATSLLMIHQTRRRSLTMNIAYICTIIGVWIDKGMGFVIPGFIPTPTGEIYEYTPSLTEVEISIGIWGLGLLMFTLFVKAVLPIQCNILHPSGNNNEGSIQGKRDNNKVYSNS